MGLLNVLIVTLGNNTYGSQVWWVYDILHKVAKRAFIEYLKIEQIKFISVAP